MKEKTFEELIEEKFKMFDLTETEKAAIKNFGKQVREATIAECTKILFDEDDPVIIWEQIKYLPTEGILTP